MTAVVFALLDLGFELQPVNDTWVATAIVAGFIFWGLSLIKIMLDSD